MLSLLPHTRAQHPRTHQHPRALSLSLSYSLTLLAAALQKCNNCLRALSLQRRTGERETTREEREREGKGTRWRERSRAQERKRERVYSVSVGVPDRAAAADARSRRGIAVRCCCGWLRCCGRDTIARARSSRQYPILAHRARTTCGSPSPSCVCVCIYAVVANEVFLILYFTVDFVVLFGELC